MLTSLANIAYVLMLCAFVTRDILHLRSLLVVAQALVVVYAWQSGVPVIAAWNLLFVGINALMAAIILRERRAVALPAELRPLYERHFTALSPSEFLHWWGQGERGTIANQRLTRAGERPEWLYFLLKGSVRVERDNGVAAQLPAGHFVAEMSLVTGDPANADVEATEAVDVMRWARGDLQQLQQANPSLWTKLQSVVGLDLVRKVQLWERRATT